MRTAYGRNLACAAALFLIGARLTAETLTGGMPAIDERPCLELNNVVIAEAGAGSAGARNAVSRLAPALPADASHSDRVCAGMILVNLAGVMTVTGRLSEAEAFARRAVDIISSMVPAEDPLLLGPLNRLARVLIAEHKITAARSAVRRINAVRSELPMHRAVLNQISANLLEAEGHGGEAESGYLAALAAWEEAGQGASLAASDLWHALGIVCLADGRVRDAERYLNRAVAIARSSGEATPVDLAQLLHSRATVYQSLHAGIEADSDFREALSLVDRDARSAPSVRGAVLDSYAAFLRQTRRKREAHELEKRSAATASRSMPDAIVDVADFARRSK